MMRSDDESADERWLQVLAGRAEPRDAAERQAAALRRYFELQAAREATLSTHDGEAEKRVLNLLRARGAFEAAAPAAAPRGWLARAGDWLFPADGGHLGRYAAVAGLAFALVLAVPWQRQWQDGPGAGDEAATLKRLPAAEPAAAAAPAPLGEGLLMSARPAEEAARLVAALAEAGVNARLEVQGSEQLVRAEVPAERLAAVQQRLAALGLAVPAPGELVVRYRPLP